MRRRFLTTWVVVALALAVLVVAGCGGDNGGTTAAKTTAPAAQSSLAPDQIVAKSMAAMDKITAASFTADVSFSAEGDTASITDPTTKQLVQSPITFHVEGGSSEKPTVAKMDMTIGLMGQNLDLSMVALDKKAWVQYDGTWYAVPQEDTKGLVEEQSSGTLPTDQLKDLGINVEDWNLTWALAGNEQVDGADCYHLTAQPDAAKIADSLMKALQDPKVLKELGGDQASQVQQLEQQNSAQLKELKQSLKDVSVELWIQTDTLYLRKGAMSVAMDTSKMKDAQGLTGASIEAGFTLADFDQPVKAVAPKAAKKLDQLMQQLMGGMMGGASGLSL